MAENIHLVVIDPQNDFCEHGEDLTVEERTERKAKGIPIRERGSLYVPGAENDMQRVADMINRMGDKINKIHVSLDCHYKYDISHPKFLRNSKGENPEPFTIISHKDAVDGVWFPIFASLPGHSPDVRYPRREG